MPLNESGSFAQQAPLVGVFNRVAMIARANISNRIKIDEYFQNEDFKMPCIGAIHGIAILAPVSQKDIANWIGIDPSDLVGVIDQLEQAGYVLRQRDPKDRRRQLLSLTEKGMVARKKLKKIGMQAMEETLAPLSEKEQEALRSMLVRVVEYNLENEK